MASALAFSGSGAARRASHRAAGKAITIRQNAVAATSTGEFRTSSGPRPEMKTPPSAVRRAPRSIWPARTRSATAKVSAM